MSTLAPLQIAAGAVAVLWPLALGLGVVVWSKARAAEQRRKMAALDGGLQGMFRQVAGQPVPDRLEIVVDTLDEHGATKGKPGVTPSQRRKVAPAS